VQGLHPKNLITLTEREITMDQKLKIVRMIADALDGKSLAVRIGNDVYQTHFHVSVYGNGRPAIRLIDAEDGSSFGVLTVNIPEAELGDWEVIVKTWSENESLAKAAIASGRFKDTGRRVPTGWAEAQVWEVL
jgi:hypothetical protein